ncbi:MAG: FAD-dependent monooxygenase [Pseudomonadota bacterium]|nr:FAD-dependent monooxygenase [Pseudomonadota bacterium]
MSQSLHDVLIIGAGPVGASLALALADADLDLVVLDAREARGRGVGERSLALSHGARLLLERLGVWTELAAEPRALTSIREIDVSQVDGFGTARLSAEDVGLPALGYVVSYSALQSVLDAALVRHGVSVCHATVAETVGATHAYAAVTCAGMPDALLGRLVVRADGVGAATPSLKRRRHDYGQCAVLASVGTRAPHDGVAFERFTDEGPLALLPEQDGYALVWTTSSARVEALLALSDAGFLEALRRRVGVRRNDFLTVGQRRSFPLTLDFARDAVGTRCALIGNAAQALHPVAAQGLSLGLRDAHQLARTIVDTPQSEIGSADMLARYARSRRYDRGAGIAVTHALASVFASPAGWMRLPRGVGLAMLDALPFARRQFTRSMLYGLR